jgi:DnaK suppressor protein
MNQQRKQAHRQHLVELASRLNGDASGLQNAALRGSGGEASGSLSNAPMHLADLATDNFEQEMAVGLLQNTEQVLRAITAALERLDAGTFGRCEACGKEIPEERLKAVPYATHCVACAQRLEQETGVDVGQGVG